MGKAKKKASGELGTEVTKVSRKNALRFLPGKTVFAGEGGASGGLGEVVAQRAYHIYLEEGCPDGRHLEHWLRAESEIAGSA
jgi:hypothetical protein